MTKRSEMRAAIYARMSTDKQNADSPADQIAQCREFAENRGWCVLEDLVVEDAGVSGASRHNRPRLLEMVARIEEWDVLLCFDFSRLARDSEDLGWIRNRLRAHRRAAYEASTGLELFNIGAKVLGVLNEEYLVKLRADVRRGLRGRVERNLFAGGTPYGYRTEAIPSGRIDPHGNDVPAGFRLVVDEEQAEVVRRIFSLYLRGEGYRSIAHQFNAEGITPPRPRSQRRKRAAWSVSALRSMLLNPIYKGEYIWGRSEWIKDHDTGKRKRYERPESEWVRRTDEAWRIVTPETWEAVHQSMLKRSHRYQRTRSGTFNGQAKGQRSHSKYLLSGFLECAECGGGFFTVTRGTHYGCGWHRDRGPEVCGNRIRVLRADLEGRVLGAIQSEILVPENVQYIVEQAVNLVKQQVSEPVVGEADHARLEEIESEFENLVRLAAKLGDLKAYEHVITELREEQRAIEQRLRNGATPIELSPRRLEQLVKERVLDLRSAFDGEPEGVRSALRALLGDTRMRVGPDPERDFRVEGVFHWSFQTQAARPPQETGRLVSVVAGEGFEPPTSGGERRKSAWVYRGSRYSCCFR